MSGSYSVYAHVCVCACMYVYVSVHVSVQQKNLDFHQPYSRTAHIVVMMHTML